MIEVQDIFKEHGQSYRENNNLPSNKRKAMDAIEACRTSALGSHHDKCPACDYTKISYNSCRNRHCPKCQNINKEEWSEARRSELMNTHYFHVVFTLPHALNTIIYRNQEVVYSLFFKCVAETLSQLALDKKYLGAQIGVTSVLHTWGQNQLYHCHLHCIVPGGGLSPSGIEFRQAKKKFFIPVKVLGKKFRGKFLDHLSKEIESGNIDIPKDMKYESLKKDLFLKNWVVYCKKPFKSPEHVINYLSRYTHKVAISNNRIVKFENGMVSFKWRDYSDKNKEKIMTVTAEEFIRRFLLHILPDKFCKIRHYGILSCRNRKTKLAKCQTLTGVTLSDLKRLTRREIMQKIFGEDVFCCPECGYEHLNRYFLE